MVPCSFCDKRFLTEASFSTHVKIIHKALLGSTCHCRYEGCTRSYQNFYSYKKHLFSKHIILHKETKETQIMKHDIASTSAMSESLSGSDTISSNKIVESGQVANLSNEFLTFNTRDFESIVQKETSQLVSKLYAEPFLPRSFVSEIVSNLNNFYNITLIPILK